MSNIDYKSKYIKYKKKYLRTLSEMKAGGWGPIQNENIITFQKT